MNQSQQLASRFNEALLNGTWVTNTNFKDLLSDVSFKEATASYKSLNSMALLTYHITIISRVFWKFLKETILLLEINTVLICLP